jgi:hypothetical protein
MNSNVDSHALLLNRGMFDNTTHADVDAMFKRACAQNAEHIVVHFHGGLIDKTAGLTAAERLIPIYQAAGAYPIFFIWESGWREVIERNVPAIFRESIFQGILARVSQGSKAKLSKELDPDRARSDSLPIPPDSVIFEELKHPKQGQEPFADIVPDLPAGTALTEKEAIQFKQMLNDDAVFQLQARGVVTALSSHGAATEVARSGVQRVSTTTLMSADMIGQVDGGASVDEMDHARTGVISTALLTARCVIVLGRVIRRFARKRHHGFYLTIVEEILRGFYLGNVGKFFWDEMKKDIDAAFGFAQGCGGTAFTRALSAVLSAATPPRVTLVGHSAGSIYACRLLNELQATSMPASAQVDLVLIAAAIDMKTLAETLRVAGSRIKGFRSFGMSDARERADAILGPAFPSSLLYFVSGVLEEEADTPLAGMERFYLPAYEAPGFEFVSAIRRFDLFAKPYSFIWAEADHGKGMACDMRSHGGWVDAPATVSSVQHILSSGFGYA